MIFYGYQCLGISKKLFRYLHALMIKIGENSETFDRPNPRFFVRYIGYWLEFLYTASDHHLILQANMIAERSPLSANDKYLLRMKMRKVTELRQKVIARKKREAFRKSQRLFKNFF